MELIEIEKIKAEIERRIAALKICGADKTEGYAGEISGLQRLLHFINSMQAEPVSEDLELASERYACKFSNSKYGHDKVKDAVIWGANWQKEQMLKDAVESVFIQDYAYARPILLGDLRRTLNLESRDKVKLIIVKED